MPTTSTASTLSYAEANGFYNVAIIIGINDYSKSMQAFDNLSNAAKDAYDLATVLHEKYKYDVHLFTENRLGELFSGHPVKEPTLNEIETFLTQDFPKIVKENSKLKTCLLFYFAGHGKAQKSDTDDIKPKGFLIPQDAHDDVKTWLEMKKVFQAFSDSNCHHAMAILDSCYSGAALWDIDRGAKITRNKLYKAHLKRFKDQATQLVMYSAAYNQTASDGIRGEAEDDSGNSPFAAALLGVLRNPSIKKDKDNAAREANPKSTGLVSKGIITSTQLLATIQSDLYNEYQQPGSRELRREFSGRQFIFYDPEFDDSEVDEDPPIDEQNNPYRGLQAFDERHAAVFFGRAKLTKELRDRLHSPTIKKSKDLQPSAPVADEVAQEATQEAVKKVSEPTPPLTIVLGNSGSGKSSLVKAGLLPLLRSESSETDDPAKDDQLRVDWRILDPIRPGVEPFMALARAFLPIEQPDLLNDEALEDLNDHFEELLKQWKDRKKREDTDNETKPSLAESLAEQAEIDFAQSWIDADDCPEAKLLIVRDYYDQERKCFRSAGIEREDLPQSREDSQTPKREDLPQSVENLYTKIGNSLDDLVKRLDEDSRQEKPTALAEIVESWNDKQQSNQSRLLLVVDQLEELLTLARSDKSKAKAEADKAEKPVSDRFMNTILAALKAHPDQFQVIMTLRLDFEPRFLTTPLKDWLPYSRFKVEPMSSDELRQAIEEPAFARALDFDPPQLVGQLIDDLGQPGALPLLSFVLSELYLDLAKDRQSNHENRALVLDEYNQPGGIVGFLSRRTDKEYETLKHDFGEEGERYQMMMQQVMLRMVTMDGGSTAKRQVLESELVYPSKQENEYCREVLDRLVKARLLVKGRDKGETYYEPAHDYLITGWARLQTWIEQEKEDLVLQQRLIPAAKDWQERKAQLLEAQNNRFSGEITRSPSVQRQGIRLVKLAFYGVGRSLFWIADKIEYLKRKFVGWRKKDSARRHEKPKDYLWNSDPRINQLSFLLDQQGWLNKLESDFVRHSIVRKQKIRTGVGVVVLFVGVVVVGAGGLAIIGQRKAQLEQTKTAIESANAKLQTGQDLDAIENVISGSTALDRGIVSLPSLSEGRVPEFSQPIDEQSNLREALFKSVYLTKERNRLSSNRGNIYQVATTPTDAKYVKTQVKIATVEEGDSVRLLDKDGEQLFQLSACPSDANCTRVYSVALGANPKTKSLQLATGGDNGVLYVWNVDTDGTIDKKEPVPPAEQLNKNSHIAQIAYNAKGTRLAAIQGGKVLLWQKDEKNSSSWVNTQTQLLPSLPEDTQALSIAFNPRNEQLAIGLNNKKIVIWDLSKSPASNPDPIEVDTEIYSIAFSQDGKTLAVGGTDSTIELFPVRKDTIDPNNPKIILTQQPRTYNLAFLGRNELLTVGVNDTIDRYSANTLKQLSGKSITAQQTKERQIRSIVYSPDNQLIATVADDNSIRLWDHQGKQLARSIERDYDVQSLAFSPDGKMLVSSGYSESAKTDALGNPIRTGWIEAWNISTQKRDLRAPIAKQSDSLPASRNVEFVIPLQRTSSNSPEIVSLGVDGTVTGLKIKKPGGSYEFKNLGEFGEYPGLAKSQTFAFAFSPTGKQRAIVNKEGVLKIWENSSGQPIYTDNQSRYISVAFSPDGTQLATGSVDGQVKIWKIPLTVDGKIQKSLSFQISAFQSHSEAVNTLAFSPDNPNRLMTGGADGEVKFWDLSQAAPNSSRLTLRGVQTIAFSPSTSVAALQTKSLLGRLPGGELLQSAWNQASPFLGFLGAWTNPKPVQRLAILDQDKQLKLWTIQPDGTAKSSDVNLDPQLEKELSLAQDRQLVLNPNGNLLIALADKTAKAWNLQSGKPIDWQGQAPVETGNAAPSPSPSLPVVSIPVEPIKAVQARFSQDGQVLITLDKDKKLKLWNVTSSTIKPLQASKPLSKVESLNQVAIDPIKQTLAILSTDDSLIELWDLQSLQRNGEFKLPQPDRQILLSPDGKILATVGQDDDKHKVIRLWERDSRNLIATLKLPETPSQTADSQTADSQTVDQVEVAFSPDSRLIIATDQIATDQKALSLWDTEGNLIAQFPGEAVKSASFTADSKHLAVVQVNGEITSWSIDRADLLAKACEMIKDSKQNSTIPQGCKPSSSTSGAAYSTGENLLISKETNLYKLAGINRFQQNQFKEAAQLLDKGLDLKLNDPEARIYSNNAKILENPANTEATIHTIAVPVPIETNPDAAQEILRGVAQAQQEINDKGGINAKEGKNGKLLRIMIANDSIMTANDSIMIANDSTMIANDSTMIANDKNLAIAKQVAQRLADDPEIDGVVGHYASDTTKAANKIYKAGKLVSISPVSSAVDLLDSPYAFRTVPDDNAAAKRLAEHMVQQQGKTNAVVFFNSDNIYSKSIADAFNKELNEQEGTVVKQIDLSNPDFDAAQEMQNMVAEEDKDTAIVLLPNSGMLDKAIKIMQENQKQHQHQPDQAFSMLGGDDVYSPTVLKDAGEAAVGLVVAVPWHINRNPNDPFVKNSCNLWQADVNWRSMTAYDAVMALAEGLRRNPNREGLAEALRANNFTTAQTTNPVRFRSSGDRDQAGDLVQVIDPEGVSRSGTGFDFDAVPIPSAMK